MSPLYPFLPVYAAPCLRGQCRLLHYLSSQTRRSGAVFKYCDSQCEGCRIGGRNALKRTYLLKSILFLYCVKGHRGIHQKCPQQKIHIHHTCYINIYILIDIQMKLFSKSPNIKKKKEFAMPILIL